MPPHHWIDLEHGELDMTAIKEGLQQVADIAAALEQGLCPRRKRACSPFGGGRYFERPFSELRASRAGATLAAT
jgi:hypothetical protein